MSFQEKTFIFGEILNENLPDVSVSHKRYFFLSFLQTTTGKVEFETNTN